MAGEWRVAPALDVRKPIVPSRASPSLSPVSRSRQSPCALSNCSESRTITAASLLTRKSSRASWASPGARSTKMLESWGPSVSGVACAQGCALMSPRPQQSFARVSGPQHERQAPGHRHRVILAEGSRGATCCRFATRTRPRQGVADALARPCRTWIPAAREVRSADRHQLPPRCANSRGPARRSSPFMQLPAYYAPPQANAPNLPVGEAQQGQSVGLPRALRAKGVQHEQHIRLARQGERPPRCAR